MAPLLQDRVPLSDAAAAAALYDEYIIRVIGLVFAAMGAIVLWEYFIFLPDEMRIHRKRRYTFGTGLLLTVRYSTLAGVLASFPYVFGNPPSCRAAGYTISTTFFIMSSSVFWIFYIRTCAIWNWKPVVKFGLGALTLAATGCWFAEIFTYGGSDDVPDIPYGGKCFQGQIQISWRAMVYMVSCAFDFVVLVLTLSRLHGLDGNHTTFTGRAKTPTQRLIWQSMLYFFPIFIVNLSGAILNLAASNPAVRAIATSYTFALVSVCAARLVFKMQDVYKKDTSLPSGSQAISLRPAPARTAKGPSITQTVVRRSDIEAEPIAIISAENMKPTKAEAGPSSVASTPQQEWATTFRTAENAEYVVSVPTATSQRSTSTSTLDNFSRPFSSFTAVPESSTSPQFAHPYAPSSSAH